MILPTVGQTITVYPHRDPDQMYDSWSCIKKPTKATVLSVHRAVTSDYARNSMGTDKSVTVRFHESINHSGTDRFHVPICMIAGGEIEARMAHKAATQELVL